MTTVTDHSAAATERRFFAAVVGAALGVVFAGFAASYYLWPLFRATHFSAGQPISPSLPFVVHLHAALFSLWVILLAVQSGLVLQGDVRAHRQLGRLGAVLLPLMILTGLVAAVRGGRDGWNPGGPYRDALSFMFVGIADLAVFGSLTAAGLAWRQRPDIHRRLMVLGTVGGLMWPAITRMPVVAGRPPLMFGLLATLVLAPAIRDLMTRSRWSRLTMGVGVLVLVTFPLRVALANSMAWRTVAEWLVR